MARWKARTCERCGREYLAGRADARYCSGACRQAARRGRMAADPHRYRHCFGEDVRRCQRDAAESVNLLGHVRAWYRRQTPQSLRELAGMPTMELGA